MLAVYGVRPPGLCRHVCPLASEARHVLSPRHATTAGGLEAQLGVLLGRAGLEQAHEVGGGVGKVQAVGGRGLQKLQ
eukprot:16387-Eustigmatos_ZCMA.PRE.1